MQERIFGQEQFISDYFAIDWDHQILEADSNEIDKSCKKFTKRFNLLQIYMHLIKIFKKQTEIKR